jgi:GH15 family glucan-1,4-alpha-glucosidase
MDVASLKLGLVGNCAVSALIDVQARVVWACAPRFDGDPMFHALIDSPEGVGPDGTFQVVLEDFSHSEQSYDHGTAVLRTRLYDTHGNAIEVTDFMPRFFLHDRPFRPMMLVRRIRPLEGRPQIRVVLRPVVDWGKSRPVRTRGSNHIRFVGPRFVVRLTSNAPLTYILDETSFSLDQPMSFIFGPDETLDRGVEDAARMLEEQTINYWRDWTRRLAIPLEWQDAVIRAAITLKLCQHEETGAIVAALTTSVPEAPGTQRNWDYRYCWLRDAFFVVRALNSLSETGTMEDYLRWLYNVIRSTPDGRVQPLYGIGLERDLPESIVPQAAGLPRHGPGAGGQCGL